MCVRYKQTGNVSLIGCLTIMSDMVSKQIYLNPIFLKTFFLIFFLVSL